MTTADSPETEAAFFDGYLCGLRVAYLAVKNGASLEDLRADYDETAEAAGMAKMEDVFRG